MSYRHAWSNTGGQVEDLSSKEFVPAGSNSYLCIYTNSYLRACSKLFRPVGPRQCLGQTELIHGLELGIVVHVLRLWKPPGEMMMMMMMIMVVVMVMY